MASRTSHNKNSAAIKRIMQEARELANDPSEEYTAAPLEDDIFEWHCTLRGPQGTDFEDGLYHFRILLPSEYPFRPPSLLMLTPNGRFELNTKLCISFTSYHEELWQPAWGIRTAILGLQGFFPLQGQAAVGVGSLEAPPSERKRLAKLSRTWVCPHCKITNLECLPDPSNAVKANSETSEQFEATSTSAEVTTTTAVNNEPLSTVDDTPTTDGNGQAEPETQNATANFSTSISLNAISLNRSPSATAIAQQLNRNRRSPRPPILLDVAIGTLIVLVCALLCRKLY